MGLDIGNQQRQVVAKGGVLGLLAKLPGASYPRRQFRQVRHVTVSSTHAIMPTRRQHGLSQPTNDFR
jgi:hypothetical protein